MNKVLRIVICLLMFQVTAVSAEDISKYQGYAKSILNNGTNNAQNIALFDLSKEIPHFSSNPFESNIEIGSNTNSQAEQAAKGDAGANLVYENYNKRDRKFEKMTEEKWFKDSLVITAEANKKLKEDFVIDCGQQKKQADNSVKLTSKQQIKDKTISKLAIALCEEPGEKTFDCQRTLQLTCQQSGDCDNGGVLAALVTSDMKWEYKYPYLTIGTIADNYWGGWCQTYDRITKFQVRNKEKITEFKLEHVGFDDYLWIKLNGHSVYIGPDGGNRIEVIDGAVESGNGRRSCERTTNWEFGLDIDLRPYLQEGENEIFMMVVVAGNGEGWMRIRAKQHCCSQWLETWENKCEIELNKISQ